MGKSEDCCLPAKPLRTGRSARDRLWRGLVSCRKLRQQIRVGKRGLESRSESGKIPPLGTLLNLPVTEHGLHFTLRHHTGLVGLASHTTGPQVWGCCQLWSDGRLHHPQARLEKGKGGSQRLLWGHGGGVTWLPLPGIPPGTSLIEVPQCAGECLRYHSSGPLQNCGVWGGMAEIRGRKCTEKRG